MSNRPSRYTRLALVGATAASLGAAGLALSPAGAQASAAPMRVTTATLTVRQAASATSAKVATLSRGTVVSAACKAIGTSVDGNTTWLSLRGKPATGWVSARYVSNVSATLGWCAKPVAMRKMHAVVNTPAQAASQLASTSTSFRTYIAAMAKSAGGTAQCPANIQVYGYWANDQAVGSDGACGGALDIWWMSGGRWHTLGFNGQLTCAEMRSAGVPHAIPATVGLGDYRCAVKRGSTWSMVPYTPAG